MEFPRLSTAEGAFTYLLATLALLVLVCGLYLLGVIYGVLPDYSEIGLLLLPPVKTCRRL